MENKFTALLYNPHQLEKEKLISRFVVRQKAFNRLFNEIKDSEMKFPEQHYLIEGQRGMGKTTFLLRLAYEIENTPTLNSWLIPIILKEEAYFGIDRLFRLWEEISYHLSELSEFNDLPKNMPLFENDTKKYEQECFNIITIALNTKRKKIIVLIDNMNEIMESLTEEESHRFREILLTSCDIRFIGASSKPLEPAYNYKHAFFDFFKLTSLNGLNEKETQRLLIDLGRLYGQDEKIEFLVKNHPERIESIRILTGGVIRTIILLFEIFTNKGTGNSFSILEKVLDSCTVLYKSRVDELAPYQRNFVKIIALNWDAMTPQEIATQAKISDEETQNVLDELEKKYVLENIIIKGKKNYYQLKERFFNIWFLMRLAPNSNKKKVLWLVKFLNNYYSRSEIAQQAQELLSSIAKGIYSPSEILMRTETFSSTDLLDSSLEHKMISTARTFLSERDAPSVQMLSQSEKDKLDYADVLFQKHEEVKAVEYISSCGDKSNYLLGKFFYLKGEYEKAMPYYIQSIANGISTANSWNGLGNCYAGLDNKQESLNSYEKAIEIDPFYTHAYFNKGLIYNGAQETEDVAIDQFKKVISLDPLYEDAYAAIGLHYHNKSSLSQAEEYYNKALEINPNQTQALYNIGLILFDKGDFQSSLPYFEKVSQIDNQPEYVIKMLIQNYENLLDFNSAYTFSKLLKEKYSQNDDNLDKKISSFELESNWKLGNNREAYEILSTIVKPITLRNQYFFIEYIFGEEIFSFLNREHYVLERIHLPFYEKSALYRFKPVGLNSPTAFYFLSDNHKIYALDFSNNPIYQNNLLDLRLNKGNAEAYITFFFDAVKGKHGKFHIVKSIEDLKFDKTVDLDPEKMFKLKELLDKKYSVVENDDHFSLTAYIAFKDSLFRAEIDVSKNDGFVSMSDEQLVLENISIIEIDIQERNEKLELLLHQTEENPDNPDILHQLGLIYENELLDIDKAIFHYEKALKVDKGNEEASFSAKRVYLKKGEYEKAINCLTSAAENGSISAANSMAYLSFTMAIHKEDAFKFAKIAFETMPNDQNIVNTMACVLLWNNKIDESLQLAKGFLYDISFIENYENDLLHYLILLAAKEECEFLKIYLEDPTLELSEFYKPFYYAILFILKSEDANRMPSELAKPVSDITERINAYVISYT